MGRFIGVDLHRNCFTVCLIAENGREYQSEYRLEEIDRFLGRLRDTDEVAVEVTGNTRLFYDLVSPHVKRIAVVNPSEFHVIRKSTKKTDKHDARALALFLSKGLLPEVRMKDKQHAELASLTQTRDALVKQRTALKNKVNNLLSSQGVNLKKEALASDKGLQKRAGHEVFTFDGDRTTNLGRANPCDQCQRCQAGKHDQRGRRQVAGP